MFLPEISSDKEKDKKKSTDRLPKLADMKKKDDSVRANSNLNFLVNVDYLN